MHRQHVERFAAEGREIARKMGDRSAVITGLRKNGEEFPADAAISKIEVGGKGILTVALRDVTEPKRVEREQRFLAEVGTVLATTLEHEEMLSKLAELAVSELADLCIVDIVESDGDVRRLKVLTRDPSKERVAKAAMHVPLDRNLPHLLGTVLVGAAPRKGEVLFWVADTGSGIEAKDLPHLFDRFWQARKARRQGAGLGLPIVKGIVEAHGGHVWVESQMGSGSTFFTLPLAPLETKTAGGSKAEVHDDRCAAREQRAAESRPWNMSSTDLHAGSWGCS